MDSEALRYRHWWASLGIACVLAVIYLSLTPYPLPGRKLGEVNINHVLAYAATALWLAQLRVNRGVGVAIPLGLSTLGVALELAQGLTSYRHFSYADMGSNAAGVVLGLLLGQPLRGRLLPALERLVRRTT